MRTLVIKPFITAKKKEEVRDQVECHLCVSGRIVFRNVKKIEEYFNEVEKHTTPLLSEVIQQFTVRGETNGDWETTITVKIIAYFYDSGSEDYAYLVKVEED